MGVISQDVRSGRKPDRNLALELVRVTEAAALAAARWVGRGDKEAADQAAVDAMRLMMHTVPMDGVVVIGEGEKDEAPMLYNGERIGDGSPPVVDIAVDPLEGTRLTALGEPSALAVVALSERGTMFDPGPCVYMEKIAGAPRIADCLSLTDPLTDVIRSVADRKGGTVGEVTVVMLDRSRHEEAVKEIRELGARIRFIKDGDVAAALLAVSQGTGVDLLWGIGGTPEGVLSAAAIKSLGGQILGRLWPRDEEERKAAQDAGYDLDRVLDADDLVGGNDVFFAATGVTDGDLLQGVRYLGDGHASTESLVMRSRSGTVRTVGARHDQAKLRERHHGPLRVKLAIAGATGYIGGLLARRLAAGGEQVRALARRPERAQDLAAAGCELSQADVLDPTSLDEALEGVGIAYYLVHSMGRGAADREFAERDRRGAENFAAAAAAAGVRRIVYLGGLGEGSEHLSSRHQTGRALAAGEVPVSYLRAAAVIGAGSESFRTVLYLVRRLPVMVTPRWVDTRTQPIAVADVIEYLAAGADLNAPLEREIEIGGPDVTTYGGMMDELAQAMGRRPPLRLRVPVLSPALSSLWVGLITPVDAGVARPLIEGLETETVVGDGSGMELIGVERTPLAEAMRRALAGEEPA